MSMAIMFMAGFIARYIVYERQTEIKH